MNLTAWRPKFWLLLVAAAMTALLPTVARGGGGCPECPGTECTNAVCNENTGLCDITNKPDSTPCGDTDQNLCTTAGCEAGQCVQTHVTTQCPPDTNDCTNDPGCNPVTGQCEHPNKPDSTPCGDTDQNLCTTAGCEMGLCVQTHQVTVCLPDNNDCTLDPPCNPATGQCTHPPVPDSSPCGPDTDGNLCTTPGCELGQCVQSHIATNCEPSTPTSTPTATPTATATLTATPTNTPVPIGGGCMASGECQLGNCVDFVCCDTVCQNPLERCDVPGHVGTCMSTPAGVPATSARGLIAAALLLASVAGLGIARRRGSLRR